MQCEMCGDAVRGTPKLVRVEGAELRVCQKCEKFGTEIQQKRGTQAQRTSVKAPGSPSPAPGTQSAYRKRDLFDYMEGEIVDDYADRIRKARMEKGLSQLEFAMQMKEKEHLIKKIENSDLIPEENVRKKIEKVLGIKLVDTEVAEEEKKQKASLAPTLGDLTIIRKAKK
jgi:putative transcription factor